METFISVFLVLQAIGAVIGAGGAVVGELFYFRAIRDGRIDTAEQEQIAVVATALRYGMILLLLASIALVLTDFVYVTPAQPALTSIYWTEMTVALIVIAASWKLSRRKVKHWLGAAVVFTGWWYLALLAFGHLNAMSFGASIAVYALATALMAAVLGYMRSLYPRGD